MGIVSIPIINPGGIAKSTRSNPNGVDLMRNSGVDAIKAPFFFGGHRISSNLPYFRGNYLESEGRAAYRFTKKYFFNNKTAIMPLIDIHSGFGSIDHVWWPFAFTTDACKDEKIYKKMAWHLKEKNLHSAYEYGPQSETYTTHGDLWDLLYLEYQNKIESENLKSRFLPWTLEIGTWSDIPLEPSKLFRKRGIFNPAKENKQAVIRNYRNFLRDFIRLASYKVSHWMK
ncbi:MAG TPA: carboxypeptidase [Leptospiraceae bacterium]|nr:carboxypeptidase [Leptospiraceae bacterium]